MKEIFYKVTQWAIDRNLVNGSNPKSQFIKYISEFGEISDCYSRRSLGGMRDGVGDCSVVLIILCAMIGIKFEDIDFDKIRMSAKNEFDEFLSDGSSVDHIFISYSLSIAKVNGIVADAILKNDVDNIRLYLPSLFFLLAVISICIDSTLDQCLEIAYDEIKDRKGVMYNGTFIKSTDSRYDEVMKLIKLN